MTKHINTEDSFTDLVDAIADLLHVHDGNDEAVQQELELAWPTAREHYKAERRHEDGVHVVVHH